MSVVKIIPNGRQPLLSPDTIPLFSNLTSVNYIPTLFVSSLKLKLKLELQFLKLHQNLKTFGEALNDMRYFLVSGPFVT